MLALTHARFQLLETVRIPIALIGSAFFPAASMLFFVVPFVGDDPVYATYATASMVTFAVMTTNLFQYGVGVAEDRSQPWSPYTRTLPVGPGPRFLGRILAGLVLMTISLIPVVLIAWLATAATVTPLAFLAALGTTFIAAIPFTLMGLGGAVRLMWSAVGDFPFDLSSTLALAGWTVALAGVATWAYRRDEGRRFS
jgi:ABC-2 type transport system permease protein